MIRFSVRKDKFFCSKGQVFLFERTSFSLLNKRIHKCPHNNQKNSNINSSDYLLIFCRKLIKLLLITGRFSPSP